MRIKRTLCFSVVAIFFGIKAFGQACNCPSPVSCGECDGEFVSLTLRYNGVQNAIISAADGGGIIFLDLFVTPGTEFTINGNQGNGRFRQNELTVRVNGLRNFTIDTSCDSPLSINSLLGSFTLVAADSKDGGPLCCSPGVEDSAPPSISNCPADIEASLTGTSCSMSVTWSAPTATDVCGIESFMAWSSSTGRQV